MFKNGKIRSVGIFRKRLRYDFMTLFYSLIISILSIFFVALFRSIFQNLFLFLIIIITFIILAISIYSFSLLNPKFILYNRELATLAISFFIVCFLLLNIDRSRSFFLLKWIGSYSSGVTLVDLSRSKHLSQLDSAAISQRLYEQIQSGNVSLKGNSFKLTSQGRLLNRFFALIARIANLEGYKKA